MSNTSSLISSFLSAIVFYTCIPLPQIFPLTIERIARFAPIIGLLLGGILALADAGLTLIGMPVLTRSALVVSLGIALTGGLHLDGAMDAADGLAVQDGERRLQVMQDSATGAFGAIAAVILIVLKTAALSEMGGNRALALIAAMGWGRWGQVVAIARYPYLRPTGKGAFHKESLRSPQDVLLGLFVLLGLAGSILAIDATQWRWVAAMVAGGGAIAFLTGYWFNRQLGGHTGDTYGAVVEWTEAFLLCLLAVFAPTI
ncbi:adenosylcobinamide-GDP ribazoletransferase [Oscillatoria sp. FACHB-1406]|uniref:adenosylcobinamide-GDP ribazoletransferase n=1 Tax=Oscillatoria sp. FACHB-1406 TaxID=2692846 RepID=UPI0016821F12|nr:adenosylcobinamide-GDP ribazoletransferase [Oscillatoria sp. FACHB-1406]MBD2579781.1 adenosylcobinamide-GDP ribazoletransferase [Oscillatoria sp. FACHB-1406]